MIKAIKAWLYGRRKRRYIKARQKLMASYGDYSQMTGEQVAEFEAKKRALHKRIMGDGNERNSKL